MPGPVDSTQAARSITLLIGQVVADRLKSRKTATRKNSGSSDQKDAAAHATGSPSLNKIVAARAQQLDPDAPDFRARLLRLVVEAALLHEFGHALINAPKFQGMIDQVLHELQASPALQPAVGAVIDSLIAKK